MEELTGFGMKNSLTLPFSANNYFNGLGDENEEAVYTYNDEFLKNFVRQSIKGGRCGIFNQYYKSTIPDEVFSNISKKLNVNGTVCEIIDECFEKTKKT